MGAITHIGPRTEGSSNVKMPLANNKVVSRWQNDSGNNVSIRKAYFSWDSLASHSGIHARAVVYSDSSGSPDALLGTSDEVTSPAQIGWQEFNFPTPFTVNSGDHVWIGVIADAEMTSTNGPTGSSVYNADAYAGGASGTFGATSSNAVALSGFLAGDDGQLRFGRSAVDPNVGNYQPSREHGEKFTLDIATVGKAAQVSAIRALVHTTDAAAKIKAAIFEDNGGIPGAKIAQTNELTGATSGAWLNLTFASAPVISEATYWIGIISDVNLQTSVTPAGGNLWVDGPDTYAGAFTSPFSVNIPAPPNGIDIYAEYTEVDPPTTAVQLSQITAEVIYAPIANVELSQVAVEVLSANPGTICRIDQLAVEVLRPNADEMAVSAQRPVVFVCT